MKKKRVKNLIIIEAVRLFLLTRAAGFYGRNVLKKFVNGTARLHIFSIMSNITEPAIEDVSVVKPVSFGPANYVLLVLSAGIGLGLLVGFIILYYREVRRKLEAKENLRKQRLNMRRKGISGMSSTYLQNSRDELLEAETEFEKTSYLEISETPTSVRVSLHGTPSSGNYST